MSDTNGYNIGGNTPSLVGTPTPLEPSRADATKQKAEDLATTMGDIGARRAELEGQYKLAEMEKKERDAAASKAKQAALEGRYREIRQEYEPKLAQTFPDFTPSKESAPQLSALGGLLMVVGAMTGRKGLMSATGAMNSMSGMLQGYQQGRKDVYEREKQQFEANFKTWQQNRTVIKEAFDRAIKFAPYDLQKATNKLVTDLKAAGADVLATTVQKSGIAAGDTVQRTSYQNTDQRLKQIMTELVQLSAQEKSLLARGAGTEAGQKLAVQLGLAPKPDTSALKPFVDPNDPNKTLYMTEDQARKKLQSGEPVVSSVKPDEYRDAINPATNKIGRQNTRTGEFQKDAQGNFIEPYVAGYVTAQQKKEDAERKAKEEEEAFQKGAGYQQALGRLLGPDVAKNTDDKRAKELVSQITSIRNTIDLVQMAKDPAINFGEVGRLTDRITSAISRNFDFLSKSNPDQNVNTSSVMSQIDKMAQDEGLSPNDKNILFYKKAIFTAMELERAARGGSILPVAIMKQLTPLLDPKSQTKEQYAAILLDRANEVARMTGLNKDQINRGVQNVETFDLQPIVSEITRPSTSGLKTPPAEVLRQAKEAISEGKDRNAVIQKMQELGYSTEGL